MRGKARDLTGDRFSILTVLELLKEREGRHRVYKCICDCGNEINVRSGSLTTGNTKSCGCLGIKINPGDRFGKLVAIKKLPKEKDMPKWLCICDCGTEVDVWGTNLLTKNTKSCGCLRVNDELTEKYRLDKRLILSTSKTVSYDTWRRHVLKRDSGTCVICGYTHKENFDMVAHHLDGFEWCAEKRVDVNNGVTVCYNCHERFHGLYGKGNNTREQFNEFKNTKYIV